MSQFIGLVHHLIANKMENGELNIDSLEALKKVLKEYEIHTKIIEEQLEMCKKDHEDLRFEMDRLMNENRDLYERLKTASKTNLYNKDRRAIEAPELEDNLQQQLSLALEEKDTMEAMWRSSIQEAEDLREQLQKYQAGKPLVDAQSKLDDVQQDYTEAIKILEEVRNSVKEDNDQLKLKCQFLEDQLKQLNSQVESASEINLSLRKSLQDSTDQEQQWKSKYLNLEAKFIELDRAYQADKVKYAQIHEYEKVEAGLKAKLEESLRTRDELQCALERCQERMQEQLRIAANDRIKVEEAVALVEGACREREEALVREKAAAEEAVKLKAELERVVDEAGRRVVMEEAGLRKQFDSQLAEVKDQLQLVEQDRNRKKAEVEQLQRECERLQDLVKQSQLSAENDKQVDKLTKKLSVAESGCERLTLENEELREELNRLEEKCRRTKQHRLKMQKDLQRLVKDTQYYQQELAMSEQKADLLNNQLQATSLDLAQLQSNTILNRGSNMAMEPQLSSTLEMYKRLNLSYAEMNDKWKNEMNTLTDKFEEKLKTVKKQGRRSVDKGTRDAK